MKYIIVELGDGLKFGVCFPKYIEHFEIAKPYKKIISAGFCDVENLKEAQYTLGSFRDMKFKCYGESVSLKLKANPERDEEILNKLLLS